MTVAVRATPTAALLWAMATLGFAAGATALRYAEAEARLQQEGRGLQRLIAQRADQHDAHLTAISALAAGLPGMTEGLRQVAESILRFYPRILAVDAVALPSGEAPALAFTTRDGCAPGSTCAAGVVRAAAVATDAMPVPLPQGPGRYLLAKRVGEGPATRALALEIDAARLLEAEAATGEAAAGARLSLTLPDGTPLLARAGDPPGSPFTVSLAFAAPIGSTSQPMLLHLERQPSLFAIVPWGLVAGFSVVVAAVAALGLGLTRSRRAAREARRRAELGEQAARLAHAGRVNALGEMASGIAHELTQPLTALLSQSQAALHLARRGSAVDAETLLAALEANVAQARRAGGILARLRDWAANDLPPPRPIEINAILRGVAALNARDMQLRGVEVALDLPDPSPIALAEPVQAEQVVHNLLRNAADAMEANPAGAPRRVSLAARTLPGGGAEIAVEDTGPGLPPAILDRLFETFFTTKPGGMGLGLPLCRTLVERMGGGIEAAAAPSGGARFVVRLAGAST
ncbi:ATP-binding protein [Roseomonas sp. CAU 1739]|uniref:sensor histidine kinase n=1 Tax=Roseomonas sp. CAU 1739 TaxID=3140364 RepID=UPI00325AFF6C